MPFLFWMFVLPVALVIGCVILLLRKQYKGLLIGAVFFCLAIATGFWSITQSRSSTAGIGILFLPGLGSICGLLAWLFGRFRGHTHQRSRLAAWLCLCGSVALLVLNVLGGFKERDKNRKTDQAQAEYSRQIDESRRRIRELLEKNRGGEVAVLSDRIQAHINDSAFLIAALETPFVSEELLDRLSRLTEPNSGGVALSVIRNKNVTPQILARLYHESAYPNYLFSDLAGNKNTPPYILRELFVNPRAAGGIPHWLARNPSTPRDILMKLAVSQDGDVLRWILSNPALDCELLQLVKSSLAQTTHPENQESYFILKSSEPRLCADRMVQ